jgi:hypothetical protein
MMKELDLRYLGLSDLIDGCLVEPCGTILTSTEEPANYWQCWIQVICCVSSAWCQVTVRGLSHISSRASPSSPVQITFILPPTVL